LQPQTRVFPKLAWISTCFSEVLQLTLPHNSNRISKTACHEKFWKNPGICKMFSSKWFQIPRARYFKTSFSKIPFVKKCINLN
jgi:hypothetical protein